MKLRTKVFVIFILVALMPLLLLTTIAYTRYTKITRQHMDEISSNIFENGTNELNNRINTIRQTAGLFTFYSDGNFSIVDNLKMFSYSDSKPDSYQVYKATSDMKFVCQNALYINNYIYGLYVFTPSGVVLSYSAVPGRDLHVGYSFADEQWYQETQQPGAPMYISPVANHDLFIGSMESVFFAQSLYDVYTKKFLGILVIDCSPNVFDLGNVNTMPEITRFTLVNQDTGNVLYSNSKSLSPRFSEADLKTYSDALDLQPLLFTAEIDYHALIREFNATGLILILSCLCCIIGVFVITRIVSRSLTHPIVHLKNKMVQQDGHSLTTSSKYLDRHDEIGTLYNEYNNMIDELNSFIKRDYQDKLIALDAQMKSLEARINSHFLFNTLESINSIAEIEENERIVTMSLALGNMFRYSIKTPSELVRIEDELKNVMDYVSIQQIRFDNRFKLHIDIPQDMYSDRVLKLILQPLVENALYHGLSYCASGDLIEVRGYVKQQYIYLYVNDNGKGIPHGELAALNARLMTEAAFTELGHRNNQSIGLKNIQTRIELYYGKGFGLSITSKESQGTQIQIKIPLLKKEQETCIPS